ncbi:OmpA family protein [Hyphomonas sp. FCG-A18]|uniref:OmpA family protein n=1 Tax=Hyphomonas sp. FCG-A18 TaxID=3080019 RepID=UPI002B2EA100|nr:OmpA family protein [Hyphomonas sp. FCG-A18]
MTQRNHLRALTGVACVLMALSTHAVAEEVEPDLLTFAQGALPISIATGENDLRVKMDKAIAMIDGNPRGFSALGKPAVDGDFVEVVFELPAETLFHRFAVPNITETPSAYQTFFRTVEIWGSAETSDDGYTLLASGRLSTHAEDGLSTELTLTEDQPEVRWIRMRLSGGIKIEAEKTFLEFSEIIGNGTQAPREPSDQFDGIWRGRGVKIELAQDGVTVSGCYDNNGRLSGTVDGNILRAVGENDAGIGSQFILLADAEGDFQGLRSTNGAPFKPYNGEVSDRAPVCKPPEPPKLGCGSIIHGIGFDYDSDALREESWPVIDALFSGLSAETAEAIEIVGHSSSEGAADYNRDLSRRRAQSVATALVDLGIDPTKLLASGRGEDEPIASNDDEAGRSLNRRVEIKCSEAE